MEIAQPSECHNKWLQIVTAFHNKWLTKAIVHGPLNGHNKCVTKMLLMVSTVTPLVPANWEAIPGGLLWLLANIQMADINGISKACECVSSKMYVIIFICEQSHSEVLSLSG